MSGADFGQWVMLGVFFWLGWQILKRFGSGSGKTMFCNACGHEGKTELKTKGSLGIEIVLWLCFLVPGLVYSIWRHSSRHPGCALCGGVNLVPADSPMALAHKRNMRDVHQP